MTFKRMPPFSPNFTGREGYLEKLRTHFSMRQGQPHSRRLFLLYGMGGVGKTQICLKFIEENPELFVGAMLHASWLAITLFTNPHRFWHVFWIDATNAETTQQSIRDIANDSAAQASGVQDSMHSVLQWISFLAQEWLLVYDNARDPAILLQFMPTHSRGNILITSRNPSMRRIVGSKASTEVGELEEQEGVSLLLSAACCDVTTAELRDAALPIVKTLCCLPLAVDQAGASIASGLCGLDEYLEIYQKHHYELLDDPCFKGASAYGQAVYGTWELSMKEIQARALSTSQSDNAQAASCAMLVLQVFAFLHHHNIPEGIFRHASEALAERNRVEEDWEEFQRHSVYWSKILHVDNEGHWDLLPFRRAIQLLESFSLVKSTP